MNTETMREIIFTDILNRDEERYDITEKSVVQISCSEVYYYIGSVLRKSNNQPHEIHRAYCQIIKEVENLVSSNKNT